MSRDVGDVIGEALGRVARETVQTLSTNAQKAQKASNGHLSGPKGLAAGAGLAALAPLAVRGASKLAGRNGASGGGPVEKARQAVTGKVTGTVKDAVGQKVDDAGGVGGAVKEAGKSMVPGMGGGKSGGTEGVPKGRRMPIQQSVDVAVPVSEAYNAWTQFEDWPKFMHRLDRVTQEDDSHVSFRTKMWGFSREFQAEIVEQRPDDRIKWRVTDGVSHSGVVSFHELAERLTRIDVDVAVHPGSLIEKAARGMRHVKRAVRADLARFKAHVEIDDEESGEWRGVVEDGDVKSTRSSAARGRSSSRSAGRSSGGGSRRASSSGSGGGGRSSSSGSGGGGRSSSSGSRSSGRSSSGGSASSRSGSSRGSGGSSSDRRASSARSRSSSSNGRSGSASSRQKTTSRS